MCLMGDNDSYCKQRYLDINGKEIDEDKESEMMEYRTEMLEDSQGNKIDTSYIEVKDEDIIEHVNTSEQHYQESQPVTLSQDSNGTFQIIVSNGGNSTPTTLSSMVSRMNHHDGGESILLDPSGEKEDDRQHVVVTTSSELGHGGETIVLRNLDEHSPEMQKEILNALLQHHADQQQHDGSSSTTTLRYVIDNRSNDNDELCSNDNVKVEAEPTSGGEMSPESLTAISGGHHHQQQQQQHYESMKSVEEQMGQ